MSSSEPQDSVAQQLCHFCHFCLVIFNDFDSVDGKWYLQRPPENPGPTSPKGWAWHLRRLRCCQPSQPSPPRRPGPSGGPGRRCETTRRKPWRPRGKPR